MKTQFLILVITILLISCKDNSMTSDYYAVAFEFSLIDGSGNDLLDSSNPNHINYTDIKLTHFLNEDYTNPSSVDGSILKLDEKRDGLTVLLIDLNDTENYDHPITKIDWGDLRSDTLKTTWIKKSGFYAFDKMWLNGELIFEFYKNDNPYYILQNNQD